MSGKENRNQDDKQGKMSSPWKKIAVLVVVVLCIWAYTRWSGKNVEMGNRIDSLFSDKRHENGGAPGEAQSVGRDSKALNGVPQPPSSPDRRDENFRSAPAPFASFTASDAKKTPSDSESLSQDSANGSRSGSDDLPTESATAAPRTALPHRAAERTAVLPPSAAPGHLQERGADSVPPAVLDVGRTLSPVQEDGMVLPAFIRDLAQRMAHSYYPAGSHPNAGKYGISVLTLKGVNVRYGLGFYGFNVPSNNPGTARRAIFSYIMSPAMLDGLYGLYADSLVSELSREAGTVERVVSGRKRPLTSGEKADMFRLYAREARALSATLAVSCEPKARRQLEAYRKALHASAQANSAYAEATMEYEAAKLDGKNIHTALDKKERAGAAYQQATRNQNAIRNDVLRLARQSGRTSALSDETVLYALFWGQRRFQSNRNALECVQTMARILDSLGTRFDKRAEGF